MPVLRRNNTIWHRLTTNEPNSASNMVPTDVEWLKSNKYAY